MSNETTRQVIFNRFCDYIAILYLQNGWRFLSWFFYCCFCLFVFVLNSANQEIKFITQIS
jgi:hypothetical protein